MKYSTHFIFTEEGYVRYDMLYEVKCEEIRSYDYNVIQKNNIFKKIYRLLRSLIK